MFKIENNSINFDNQNIDKILNDFFSEKLTFFEDLIKISETFIEI